jgi:hypothetical protein
MNPNLEFVQRRLRRWEHCLKIREIWKRLEAEAHTKNNFLTKHSAYKLKETFALQALGITSLPIFPAYEEQSFYFLLVESQPLPPSPLLQQVTGDNCAKTKAVVASFRSMLCIGTRIRLLYFFLVVHSSVFLEFQIFLVYMAPPTHPAVFGSCPKLTFALKGTVSRDFLLLVFFMNQFPPSPRVSH